MYRRLMENYEPDTLDVIHDYLERMEPELQPLWEIAKRAEKHRVRIIYENSRQKQKEMQKHREEWNIQHILKGE